MIYVLLLPFLLVGAAAVAAVVSVRRSSLGITTAGVEIRNYPQAPKLIPLEQVAQFEATVPVGNFAFLRPKTAALVLTDGSRIPVRTITAPEASYGIEALNNRVESLRRGG